ncbi:MAG: cation transporter [Vampirovibrio sp.]|nr:cation transporter [Vampirovibrio sp.]
MTAIDPHPHQYHDEHDHHLHLDEAESQPISKVHLWQLFGVLVLTLGYASVEWWGSGKTHSVALLADAGHMVVDASGLLLTLAGGVISLVAQSLQANEKALKVEKIAALLNGLGLVGLSLYLWWTGFEQLASPKMIDAMPLLQIASGGFVVNLIAVFILHGGQKDNINVKGAYLHVLFDLLGSVTAIVSAVAVMVWHVYWLDPILSLGVAGLVSYSTWQFLKLVLSSDAKPHTGGCGHHH